MGTEHNSWGAVGDGCVWVSCQCLTVLCGDGRGEGNKACCEQRAKPAVRGQS